MRLAGKVAIVTGAGQGIGRGIAVVYAREGATVVVAERKEHRAERTAAEIRAAGGRALALATDVSDRRDVTAMVERTLREFGRLDVLVNNAQGMHEHRPLEDLTDEEFDVFLVSGLKGTFWAMQAAFPAMKAQGGGRIINMVSLNALVGAPGLADYNATKAAIQALSRTAARSSPSARWKARWRYRCCWSRPSSRRRPARRVRFPMPKGRVFDPE